MYCRLFNYIAALICVFALREGAFGAEVCYGDLGCFDDSASCHTFRFPPDTPAQINTRFYLYTRSNQGVNDYALIDRANVDTIRNSAFDGYLKTAFIIHGYTDTIFSDYFQAIKDSLLNRENMNVIMVDWNDGASGLDYFKCRQNTRVVGREIAVLARTLNLEMGATYGDMHLIGHSLGAHTSGYAGAYQPGFGRISGLDPAGPGFTDVTTECRLDPSDALFVDNIHTDGAELLGMGIMEEMGHADFYPNGGDDMPGCGPLQGVSCDHFRAVYYFEESIRVTACTFTSYPCNSWSQYNAGLCQHCGLAGCPEMGYNADPATAVGTLYLATNANEAYCQQ